MTAPEHVRVHRWWLWRRWTRSGPAIAEEYGVTRTYVWQIGQGYRPKRMRLAGA